MDAKHHLNVKRNPSPRPQSLDPNLASFNNDPSFTQDYSSFTTFSQQELQQQLEANALSPNYPHSTPALSPVGSGQGSTQISPIDNNSGGFPAFSYPQNFDQTNGLDPSLFGDLDPTGLDPFQTNGFAVNTNTMAATMQSHSPTPPHLMNSQSYNSRPRNASESLDPASAMYPQNEWGSMGMFNKHRRSPSDNISEYSSHSNQASPYMSNLDSFDGQASPLLIPSTDPSMTTDLGLQQFTLSDTHSNHGLSPGHSPHISPQQQALPPFTANDNFGLSAGMNGQFMQNDMELFPQNGGEAFPNMNSQGDLGAADTMSPPEINIISVPYESRNFNEVSRPVNAEDSLSPPLRNQSRNRMRAKSDSYAGGRPPAPGFTGRGRSPSLQPSAAADNLSPFDASSREPSPARGRDSSAGSRRARSSSRASDQRDYILDLANPERTPSTGGEGKRLQKHPATFQCTLCPKKFTRAYNLRSHLRTHTDERPFVCTVCGKAFARQHDRKRHEGLHSGEKKFVCRGTLQGGSQWGCGRKFARADALGRHFRSEAGRICIKPLLDEEAAERQKAWMEEQQQVQAQAGMMGTQSMMAQQPMDMMGGFLPAALLQQYPALAGIDWNAMPQGPPPDEDYIGRSSFEGGASSGGEFYDDMSENELAYNNNGMQMNLQGGGQQMGVYGNSNSDFGG